MQGADFVFYITILLGVREFVSACELVSLFLGITSPLVEGHPAIYTSSMNNIRGGQRSKCPEM